MRTPERCPWCGAELVDTINDSEGQLWAVHYACGLVLSPWQSLGGESCECERSDTPSAIAYRQTLAWRKRLSQHTGVPLRMVPNPTETGLSENKCPYASWGFEGWAICVGVKLDLQEVGYDGKARWHGYDLGIDARFRREEARRRLLAKGE